MATITMRTNVYFLDRNVLATIRLYNEKRPVQSHDKRVMLNKLRKLDRPNNVFSLIVSINEGQSARIETANEFQSSFERDADSLGNFFRYARTDVDIMKKLLSPNNQESIETLYEERIADYLSFIEMASQYLYQPLSKARKIEVRDMLIKEARTRNIDTQHPILICCLAVLFGSATARGILKPTQDARNSYNALSDIMVISRICRVVAAGKGSRGSAGPNLRFITLDKKLSEFLRHMTIIEVDSALDETGHYTKTTLEINPLMFPDLQKSEVAELLSLLKLP